MYDIPVTLTTNPKKKPEDESKLGFGKIFTDHMFIMDYEQGRGWHDARVVPYGPFVMDPACTVFHYAQEIFEGMKCYRRKDGGLNLFRPRDNFARMNRSAERMGMPKIDVEEAMAGLVALLKADADWVPSAPGTSLYIRPTMISTDVMLGVHASRTYRFFIICSPSGAYYARGWLRLVFMSSRSWFAQLKAAWASPRPAATMRHLFSRVISLRKKDMSRFSGWMARRTNTSRKSAR